MNENNNMMYIPSDNSILPSMMKQNVYDLIICNLGERNISIHWPQQTWG